MKEKIKLTKNTQNEDKVLATYAGYKMETNDTLKIRRQHTKSVIYTHSIGRTLYITMLSMLSSICKIGCMTY